ncbi:MAG: Ig family protein, partial [Acidobacteria bacterium]|nr:Ig family protein [Acidobacteriota bacterium]
KARYLIPLLFSLLSATAAIAQDATPPNITTVQPSAGSVAGGTAVTISGSKFDLPAGFACILPCPGKVFFGGVEATVRELTNSQIIVLTPAHAAGTVDVVVRTGDGRTATAANAYTYSATAESSYALLLLPIYLDAPVHGSNKSVWETDFWIRNNSAKESAQLAPWPCPADGVCPAIFPTSRTLVPGETLHNLNPFFRDPNAAISRLLYVSRNAAASVSTDLRVFDTSRNALDAGTEIPVVRESSLLNDTTATLHNVPTSPFSRVLLRIYDLSQLPSDFTVLIYPEAAGTETPLVHNTLRVTTKQPETGEFRTQPGLAELDLGQYAPRTGAMRVVITPVNAGSRYWPMISVTNNSTQHVTLVTPQ